MSIFHHPSHKFLIVGVFTLGILVWLVWFGYHQLSGLSSGTTTAPVADPDASLPLSEEEVARARNALPSRVTRVEGQTSTSTDSAVPATEGSETPEDIGNSSVHFSEEEVDVQSSSENEEDSPSGQDNESTISEDEESSLGEEESGSSGIQVVSVSATDVDAAGEQEDRSLEGTIYGIDEQARTFILSEASEEGSFTIEVASAADIYLDQSKVTFDNLQVGDIVSVQGRAAAASREIVVDEVRVTGVMEIAP